MQSEKQKLRSHFLEIRNGIPEDQYLKNSTAIRKRLLTWDQLCTARTIHTYLSIPEHREVDTRMLVPELLDMGKRVVVPVIQPQYELRHVYVTKHTQFETGRWGVAEPVDGEEADPGVLDLILVPMVAGDREKHRIGYGKGFYDRFLRQTRAVTAGLLFEQTRYSGCFPSEPHDHPLDVLVTEDAIY